MEHSSSDRMAFSSGGSPSEPTSVFVYSALEEGVSYLVVRAADVCTLAPSEILLGLPRLLESGLS